MRFLLFLFFLAGFATVASAQSACQAPHGNIPINVTATEVPLKTNFTLNRQQMNIQGGAILQNQGTLGTSHVGGLANSRILSSMETAYANSGVMINGRGFACAALSQITIVIQYEPNIFISREFIPGSCYFNAVMQHEQKHLATDRDIIRAYIPHIQTILANAVRQLGTRGPVAAEQVTQLNQQMNGTLNASLDQVMNALKTEREARQAAVDSPAEYARVKSLCQNWP